ncbi:MAG TPA: hypothetical protein VMZ26_15635 [Pyrinomonadaceae bacterium]|nr:hypothetical protein [Pyrinomonadaceae bacterium]
MIDPATVGEIIAQYKKHGWTPRRALLSDVNRTSLLTTFGDIEIEFSDIDALWFSRRSNLVSEAWELRRLTSSPFALIAIIPSTMPPDEMELTLEQVADEMRAKTIA